MARSIRTHLLAAFAVIVAISLTAVLFSWVSVKNTREKLDVIVSETLPLISNSLKLDKYAQLFSLYIHEFHEINSTTEHEDLTKKLDTCIEEIEVLLDNLELLKFDSDRIQLIRSQTNQLVESMAEQNEHFHVFSKASSTLQQAVAALREKQQTFITITTPQVDNSYQDFLDKSDSISSEMRKFISRFETDPLNTNAALLDSKVRVGFDTLVSSAAGEMRYTLEAVALTYLATSLLYEAANSRELDQINRLEAQFQQLIPKIRTIRLILSHSSPDKHDVIISAVPIFNFGVDKSVPSIFNLRRQELLLRKIAANAAGDALLFGENLTAALDDLNVATEELAASTSNQLHANLKMAQTVQIVLGVSAVLFSLLIAWLYVEKAVISRISALRAAMESGSKGGEMDIHTSGNDEISYMARALYTFIDQQKTAESRIRTTLDELNAVLDNIEYGIVFLDSKLNVQLTNRAFVQMWEILPTTLSQALSLEQLIDSTICTNINLPNAESVSLSPENITKVLCRSALSPTEIELHNGKIFQHQCYEFGEKGQMLTFFDITDLKENQRNLVQAKKTETIGLMAGGVAHDLNNILSGIVSYPDLLLSQLSEESNLRQPIETIKKSGQRAAAVVADLLTITRGAISQKEVANINTLVKEYLTSPEGMQLKELYPEVIISTELSTQPLYCKCVPMQIKKCLMNVIANAAEAIGSSGTVNISVAVDIPSSLLPLPKELEMSELLVITVSDNGPGISEEDIKHIFEPFYSRKVMGRSGTGLGLTIVWNTLKDHGGGILVESDKRGTLFHLLLPVEHGLDLEAKSLSTVVEMQGNGEHILVVDDEQLQRDIASRMLSTLNYQITAVASGEEAMRLIKEQEFDLILLDMVMSPGINGRETFEQIVTLKPEQRAVIISGYSGSEDIDMARSLGVKESLLKPYTVKQLGETVKKALS